MVLERLPLEQDVAAGAEAPPPQSLSRGSYQYTRAFGSMYWISLDIV